MKPESHLKRSWEQMRREYLISYAQEFVSFLIVAIERELLEKIRSIILFGSSVRGEASRKSDIDIFIDVSSGEKEVDMALEAILEDFYAQAERRWRSRRINNPISLKVGKLSEWKDLHPSIITDGFILYGKYKPEKVEGKHFVIFSWENTRLTDSKRILLNRQLYGYNRLGKRYEGLLQKHGGEKLSSGSILVPLEHLKTFEDIFKKYRIGAKILQIVRY